MPEVKPYSRTHKAGLRFLKGQLGFCPTKEGISYIQSPAKSDIFQSWEAFSTWLKHLDVSHRKIIAKPMHGTRATRADFLQPFLGGQAPGFVASGPGKKGQPHEMEFLQQPM